MINTHLLKCTIGIATLLPLSILASELWVSETREQCKSYYEGNETRQGYVNSSYNYLLRSEIIGHLNSAIVNENKDYKVFIEVNAEIDHAAFLVEVNNGDGYCELFYRKGTNENLHEIGECIIPDFLDLGKKPKYGVSDGSLSSASGIILLFEYSKEHGKNFSCKQESYYPINFINNANFSRRFRQFK